MSPEATTPKPPPKARTPTLLPEARTPSLPPEACTPVPKAVLAALYVPDSAEAILGPPRYDVQV